MQLRCADRAVALKFPRKNRSEIFVATQRFTVGRLMFLPEMSATGFIAFEGIDAHQFRELEIIGHATRAFERLVVFLAPAEHADVAPKFFAELGDARERCAQSGGVPRHAALIPHEQTELAVE